MIISNVPGSRKKGRWKISFHFFFLISFGKIIGNRVEFRNQKGCWIGCTVEGAYESFTVEAKIKNI